MSTESNVESLLKAILTGDEEYIVVPQSRVEELLLAIYKNGGGGGGGGTAGIKYLGVIDDYKNLSTTAKKGDYYLAGTADKYKNIHVGDMLIAQKDSPAATIDNSNYRLLHTELDTDTTYTITQDSKDAHIFYFKASTETGTGTKITIPDNDTKSTAASDEKSSTKLYLVGTMTQDASGVKTYANAKVYIGTDNCLYSNGEKVALQSEVDKKVNKTSVSLSKPDGETTSVINVTDAKAQMAMVAKISGKTVKFNQLILDQTKGTNKYDSGNITVTTSDHHTITVDKNPSALTAPSLGAINFTKDHIYYVTGCPDGGGSNSYSMDCPGIFECSNAMGSRFTASSTTTSSARLRLSPNTTWTNKTFKPQLYDLTVMFGSGKEPTLEQCVALFSGINSVYNAGELWSAPVESVVSRGLNMADTIYGKTLNVTYGTEGDGIGVISNFVEVDYSKTYYVTGISTNASNNCFYAWYDANKNFIARSTSVARTYIGITGLPSNAKYIRVNQYLQSTSEYASVKLMMSESASTPYTPYNKTTVLVPSAVKNLPDYGCSVGNIANEIDFENGVYYHRVKKIKLATLSWESPTDYQGHRRIAAANVKTGGSGTSMSLISNVYTADTSPVGNGAIDKTICFYNASLYVSDWSNQTDKATFVKRLQDTDAEVVYELASVETIPLSDYLRPLPVENGGTLTLVNKHNLDINSTIKYKKEVN